MPLLILPDSWPASDAWLDACSGKLCPYRDAPRPMLRHAGLMVWGTSLVKRADGGLENALGSGTASFRVSIEEQALVVRTDPLGTCPIWYGRSADGWVVSPEAKAIATVMAVRLRPEQELLFAGSRPPDWSPYENLERLAPGCSLHLIGARLEVSGHPVRFRTEPEEEDPGAPAANRWADELGQAFLARLSSDRSTEERTAAFVSGGIDSTIACALARRWGAVQTLTLGTDHGNEFPGARAVAATLDCAQREVHLDLAGAREEFERATVVNEIFDGLSAEILMQLSALYGSAEGDCTRVVTGYGSDLLFDGMLRHTAYMDAVGLTTSVELIERTRWTGELAPFLHWSRGIAAEHVFWDAALIDLALRIPRRHCFVDGVEKHVLREASVRSGLLPGELAFQPKVGMTDGTAANRLLSEALGVEAPYGYRDKSLVCIARLRRLFGGAR